MLGKKFNMSLGIFLLKKIVKKMVVLFLRFTVLKGLFCEVHPGFAHSPVDEYHKVTDSAKERKLMDALFRKIVVFSTLFKKENS